MAKVKYHPMGIFTGALNKNEIKHEKIKKPAGRKPKAEEEKQDQRIAFYITKAEMKYLEEESKKLYTTPDLMAKIILRLNGLLGKED